MSPVLTVSHPFFSDVRHGQVQHFQQAVIVWEDRLGFGDFPQLPVESLNGIGCVNQEPDCLWVLEMG